MQKFVNHRQRGTAIAFILMAVIAILAIVVVLLSRAARRDDPNVIEAPAAEEITTGTETAEPDFATTAPSPTITPSASENFQGSVPPPPPLPPATPDSRDLPPEG